MCILPTMSDWVAIARARAICNCWERVGCSASSLAISDFESTYTVVSDVAATDTLCAHLCSRPMWPMKSPGLRGPISCSPWWLKSSGPHFSMHVSSSPSSSSCRSGVTRKDLFFRRVGVMSCATVWVSKCVGSARGRGVGEGVSSSEYFSSWAGSCECESRGWSRCGRGGGGTGRVVWVDEAKGVVGSSDSISWKSSELCGEAAKIEAKEKAEAGSGWAEAGSAKV
mmetsp:Transcript_18087/g.40587  ORF Transcript_18087/g.40587 Transcript_18087/m.40587 type:complete len:226 (-) Transcript_18087:153-830(-)